MNKKKNKNKPLSSAFVSVLFFSLACLKRAGIKGSCCCICMDDNVVIPRDLCTIKANQIK